MARSRNIKPGFFANDKLAECEPLARLLFAGLWTICDREGRAEDRPKRIRAELLPYDMCDADALLSQLAEAGFLLRYEVDGGKYLQVVNFHKHQDPHYKEKASEIPAPFGHMDSAKTPGGVPESIRQSVFDRDGRACKACGSSDDLSLDHVIPRSKGGSHDEGNLQTLCRRCNSVKNNREAGSIISQSSVDDKPASADRPGGKSPLIPSSLIPDSLISDSVPNGTIGASVPWAESELPAEKTTGKYPPEFETVWQAYPQRPGASKADSHKAWAARVKAGATPDALLAGVNRYAAYCAACKTEPAYIKQPTTFFGPGEHYLSDWSLPAAGPPRNGTSKFAAAAAGIFPTHNQGEVIDV